MKTAELLIELGTEEIPARMLPAAAADLEALLLDLLDRAGLPHGPARRFWTPRRLAVRVEAVAAATPLREELLLGPPAAAAWDAAGQPTNALLGFARKSGREVAEFTRTETPKGVYAGATVKAGDEPLSSVLAAGFAPAVGRMTFAKMMRWGDGLARFVRPIHWIVALYGDEILPLVLFGVRAGRASRGHRVLGPGPFELPDAAAWEPTLERHGVVADPFARRARLATQLAELAAAQGGTLVQDEGLLDESADIVEYPGAQLGRFEPHFVSDLPAEVLGSCLKTHQKGFCVRGPAGLLPLFAVAVNRPDDPEGHVRRGHEWVVSGRLEDALFFWTEDRRQPLAERASKLEGIVFQRELGTYAAKTRRVVALVGRLAGLAGLDAGERAAAERAAALARCDLPTGLVGEFPELQGICGGLLARADGEPEVVAGAIYDLYLPAGADDPLPATRTGRLLGLADRLDTLAGGFAAGLVPSGSSDPFALRRAGIGAIRLALAEPTVDLAAAVGEAALGYRGGEYGSDLTGRADQTVATLLGFLVERFGALAERDGARYDEIKATTALAGGTAGTPFRPADLWRRLAALRAFRESEDFLALAAAAKRVRNILAQADERGDAYVAGEGESALREPEELRLAAAIGAAERELAAAAAAGDYERALAHVARLRPDVDLFFDKIMVMDKDPVLRRARLSLLDRVARATHGVVDMAELVVAG
ncbi:MAG: glycine--tRNA ligase subunit beta [Acidobacteria bacterium]|jgi:glycyl-tRNA synthetase beta chain|nr:glycine--tRNA ligase subunit beta [Acidobacteriota bacterium]MCU0253171.1 glycine--tRNA ligase subunit beta [Acidobacteriota bacterium]